MAELIEQIFVNTPKGKKHHGDVIKSDTGQFVFRRVLTERDKMSNFDAWSLNNDFFFGKTFKFFNIVGLWFITPEGQLKLKTEDLRKMLSGELRGERNQKLAFTKSDYAEPTIYIKSEAFTKI